MGACCVTCDAEKEVNYDKEIYSTRPSAKYKTRKGIKFRTLSELVQDGDPEAIAKVARLQGLVRHFMIKRRLLKDKKHMDSDRKRYFSTTDYLETINPTNEIDLSSLLPSSTSVLERRIHDYQQTNATYSGQWLGGFRHGQGSMVFKDGARYIGQWQLGQPHGYGRFELANGIKYEGMFALGRAYGPGKSFDREGNTYVGEFALDRKHGFGKTKSAQGNYYKGSFVEGKQTGFGSKKWKNGATYEGMWLDNNFHGFGYYLTANMSKNYLGDYVHNKMEGFGQMEWTDGRKHRGFWSNDLKEGYGIQTNQDGSTISSTWIRGKIYGYGAYSKSEKHPIKYGIWKNGKKVTTLSDEQVEKFKADLQEAEQFFGGDKEDWDQILKLNEALFEVPQEFKKYEYLHQQKLLTHRKEAAILLHSEVVAPQKPAGSSTQSQRQIRSARQRSENPYLQTIKETDDSGFSVHSPMVMKLSPLKTDFEQTPDRSLRSAMRHAENSGSHARAQSAMQVNQDKPRLGSISELQ